MVTFNKNNVVETKRDISILIVDDDDLILNVIFKILKESDKQYYIETAKTVNRLFDLVKKTYWDTILLDLSIPFDEGGSPDHRNGLHALDALKSTYNITTPIIAITGYNELELSDIVLDKGAYYFLTKPLRPKSLSAIVKNSTRFQMSGFDGLTGLLNRKTFEERLKAEFERAIRKNSRKEAHADVSASNAPESPLSLIYLDGDNFKEFNDTYDHLIGDMVIKKISGSFVDESIYRPIREGESYRYIVRPYDLAARFGGDEFCLFLPETDHPNALIVARRIREMLKAIDITDIIGADHVSHDLTSVSVSIGIATYPYPNNAADYMELIKFADHAMYGSKEGKKGHIFGYGSKGKLVNFDASQAT
jgi:two-component system cell cycle response regulator